MADTPPQSSQPSTPPSSAADQARIRKERREAKIRAGGSARLNKITGLGGGVQREAPPQPSATTSHADPDEVDISQHYYEPNSNRAPRRANASSAPGSQMNDDQLRQMMLGFDPSSSSTPPPPGANPFAGFPGMGGMGMGMPGMENMGGAPSADDPMMKMLQQMMGGAPGEGAGNMPSFPGMPTQAPNGAAADPYAYVWRIIHALFALSLGLYITIYTPFTGTKLARDTSRFNAAETGLSDASVHFFWLFATAEIVLQSSRFFMEKGRVQQGGMFGMVVGLLPEPWKGYVQLISRYGRIWTTVSQDAMALVFVLGVCAWLRAS